MPKTPSVDCDRAFGQKVLSLLPRIKPFDQTFAVPNCRTGKLFRKERNRLNMAEGQGEPKKVSPNAYTTPKSSILFGPQRLSTPRHFLPLFSFAFFLDCLYFTIDEL
jgi:hypothetical protein